MLAPGVRRKIPGKYLGKSEILTRVFPMPFGASQRLERPPPCVWVQLSDALHRSRTHPTSSVKTCGRALQQCLSVSGRRGPATAPLLCNILCAARTFDHTRMWAYAHCSISGKWPPEAVKTSRHAVEAGHSTGGERGAASPFGFDAAEHLRGRTAAALHVPGPDFDHMGEVLK